MGTEATDQAITGINQNRTFKKINLKLPPWGPVYGGALWDRSKKVVTVIT